MTQFSSKILWANLHINTGFISLKCINRDGNSNLFERGTVDKGMIHVSGRREGSGTRFQHTSQNGVQFKTCELFIFESFHLRFSTMVDQE